MSNINTVDNDHYNGGDSAAIKWIILGGLVLLSPITAITALVMTLLFTYGRIKQRVLIAFTAPVLVVGLLFIKSWFSSFYSSWATIFPSILAKETSIISGVFSMLSAQIGFSVLIGILIGYTINAITWFNRARWKTIVFRRTPWEIYRKYKNIKKIRNDEDTPTDGMTLGVVLDTKHGEYGKRKVQTWQAAAAHTFMVGGSGTGKSSTATMRIRDQIANGDSAIIVDLKNDPELANNVYNMAKRYGRKVQHFIVQDALMPYTGPCPEGPAHYDPLSRGDLTQRADMVLELRDWTNADYYKKQTQSYLQLLFRVLIANPNPKVSTLEDAITLFNPKVLQQRAIPLASQNDPILQSAVQSVDALNDERQSSNFRENLQTNRSQLEIFLQSVAGPWLRLDQKNHNNINLMEASVNGDVIIFSIDSLKYGELAKNLANLITQDLKTVASERLSTGQTSKRVHVFIDEFSAIGSNNIIGLINKARAANMSVTIATQALGDLETQGSTLRKQLLGIVSSFIIHRGNTLEDNLVYSGLTGTELVYQSTEKVEHKQSLFAGIGKGIGTGSANVQEVEQYRVTSEQIKQLGQGQFYYLNTVDNTQTKIQCIIEDEMLKKAPLQPHPMDNNSSQKNQEPAPQPEIIEPMKSQKKNSTNHFMEDLKESSQNVTNEYLNQSEEDTTIEEAFAEISLMKKQPLNYEMLKRMSNNPDRIEAQRKKDERDGVEATSRQKKLAKLMGTSIPGVNTPRRTQKPVKAAKPTPPSSHSATSMQSSGKTPFKKRPFLSRPNHNVEHNSSTTHEEKRMPVKRPRKKNANDGFDF